VQQGFGPAIEHQDVQRPKDLRPPSAYVQVYFADIQQLQPDPLPTESELEDLFRRMGVEHPFAHGDD
jgi:hypothetical protein